jgi:L-cystine uptake protein TcyP (sodium:dicarboxylate symporter family)
MIIDVFTTVITVLFFFVCVTLVAAFIGIVAAGVLAWRAQRDIETADRQLPR